MVYYQWETVKWIFNWRIEKIKGNNICICHTKRNETTAVTPVVIKLSDFISIISEVSASFKSGTSVSYIFKEQVFSELNRSSSSALLSSIYSDMTLRAENVSLSFRTSQSPALLLYIGSYHQEYLALLLNRHGECSDPLICNKDFLFFNCFVLYLSICIHPCSISMLFIIFVFCMNKLN